MNVNHTHAVCSQREGARHCHHDMLSFEVIISPSRNITLTRQRDKNNTLTECILNTKKYHVRDVQIPWPQYVAQSVVFLLSDWSARLKDENSILV